MEGLHRPVRHLARRVHKVVQTEVVDQHRIVHVQMLLAVEDLTAQVQLVQVFPNQELIAEAVRFHRGRRWVVPMIRRAFVRELSSQ